MAYLRRLRSHQLCFEELSVMLGWRWESPERGQRQPLFGCSRQREKTLNKVFTQLVTRARKLST